VVKKSIKKKKQKEEVFHCYTTPSSHKEEECPQCGLQVHKGKSCERCGGEKPSNPCPLCGAHLFGDICGWCLYGRNKV